MPTRFAACLAVALTVAAPLAHATSCAPMLEQYYLTCSGGQCQTRLRVAQVEAFGMCGRRDRVQKLDSTHAQYMISLLHAARPQHEDGVYVLTFGFRHWDYDTTPTFDAFQRNLASQFPSGREAQPSLSNYPVTALVQRLQGQSGAGWITRQATTAEGFDALAASLKRAELFQLGETAGLWSVYWISFFGLLIALVHSTQQFFARVYGGEIERSKGLRRPLLTQACVLALSALGLVTIFAVELPWPGLLLVPAVVVIWLAEGWSYYRARTVHSPKNNTA